MKVVMVMYDSLSRRLLEPYGCSWVKTPNFSRLAKHSVRFDNNYIGSMPCMPARRELHTGRYNFLHRSWGPMEPFDDSMPEILKNNGIYSHLVSDHQHYWEDGGATYHNRYNSWEISRGQEGDTWKADLCIKPAETGFQNQSILESIPLMKRMHTHDAINRSYCNSEDKMPQAVTFEYGLDFIDKNKEADRWFLQIETFDPHEPFYTQPEYQHMYPDDYEGPEADWPPYYFVNEDSRTVNHTRNRYAALITMCDAYLGKVLDKFDEYDLWKDTMLIVNTDHGLLVGEHGWWNKSAMPVYQEIAHTPLFIYDPRSKACKETRKSLTQTIDLPATILDFFGIELPADMQGKPLRSVIERDEPVREYALFGYHGGHINVVGRNKVYMRAAVSMDNAPVFEYTLMPTHMRSMFSVNELQKLELHNPFTFTKGCKLMRIPAMPDGTNSVNFGTLLFDLDSDPGQIHEIDNPALEAGMAKEMVRLMRENDCPKEQYLRMGLPMDPEEITPELIEKTRVAFKEAKKPPVLNNLMWSEGAQNVYWAVKKMLPSDGLKDFHSRLEKQFTGGAITALGTDDLLHIINHMVPDHMRPRTAYFLKLASRTK